MTEPNPNEPQTLREYVQAEGGWLRALRSAFREMSPVQRRTLAVLFALGGLGWVAVAVTLLVD